MGLVALLLLSSIVCAQDFLPARAGLIRQSRGRVLLDEHPIAETTAILLPIHEVKPAGRLRTENGVAEIFLGPRVLLLVSQNTEIELLSPAFSDVRVRLIAGSAVVDADQFETSYVVTLLLGDSEVQLQRAGLYCFTLTAARFRVQVVAGRAVVTGPRPALRVNGKQELELGGEFAVRKAVAGCATPRARANRRVDLSDPPTLSPWWTLPGIYTVP